MRITNHCHLRPIYVVCNSVNQDQTAIHGDQSDMGPKCLNKSQNKSEFFKRRCHFQQHL